MESFEAFLYMGGYAAYVWPAFAVAAVVLLGLFLASWRSWRRTEAVLAGLQGGVRRRARRRGAAPAEPEVIARDA